MAVNSIKQLVDAELEWRVRTYQWRKVPTQATSAGVWFDMSMSPWNPVPKYWFDSTPLIAKQISQSTDGWLFHWANVSPQKKYLRMTTSMCAVTTWLPLPLILCDYLLYYPSIDDSVTDPQILDNTQTLPRYTDWKWVQAIAVTLAARAWFKYFYFTYTNSDWVPWRISQTVRQNTNSAIWTITTSTTATVGMDWNPFIGLQAGDSWIRSIESVTMLWWDVWLFALILVKPLARTMIREQTAPVEKDYLIEESNIPEIQDDAYLSWLTNPTWSLNGVTLFWDTKIIYN